MCVKLYELRSCVLNALSNMGKLLDTNITVDRVPANNANEGVSTPGLPTDFEPLTDLTKLPLSQRTTAVYARSVFSLQTANCSLCVQLLEQVTLMISSQI